MAPEQAQREKRSATKFIPIPVASLRLDTVAEFDLYLQYQPERPPLLYREKNLPFTRADLARLSDGGVEILLIDSGQEGAYIRYVEQNLGTILADDSVQMDHKCEVLYVASRCLMKEVMNDPRAGDAMSRSRNLVENTYAFLHSERSAFANLLKVTSFDYYTYTHSVNVFVFSIALAEKCSGAGPEVLKAFGMGALLHDVGKSSLDPAIVNATGRLTEAQWLQMQRHPQLGHELLSEQGEMDSLTLDVVLHHHEKIRGGGYPDDLSGEQLSPFVRICTIADIFDALTTRRSYKEALRTFPALQLMQAEMSKDLDGVLFRTFVTMMGNSNG